MVDEVFLQNAVRIRRTYLKLSNNMDLYQKKAQQVSNKLDETLVKIEKIENAKLKKKISEYFFFLNKLL